MLVEAALLGASAAASPGPFQAVLLQRAVRAGPWRALHLAAVPVVSDPPVIAACLLMLAGMPAGLVRLLQLGGGGLLCWMGVSALRELGRGGGAEADARPARDLGFAQAVLVNLLNPNVWIFWSLVGGPLLGEALRRSPGSAALFLAAFYLPLVATGAALVAVFGAVGRLGPRAARLLGGASALAFLGLGLTQLWRGAAG